MKIPGTATQGFGDSASQIRPPASAMGDRRMRLPAAASDLLARNMVIAARNEPAPNTEVATGTQTSLPPKVSVI